MALQRVDDGDAFLSALRGAGDPVVVGFFGDFSEASKEAKPAFEAFCADHPEQDSYLVDVAQTKNVHGNLGVSTVPTVLLVKGDAVLRKVMGVQSATFYTRALLDHTAAHKADGSEGKRAHRVTVYVTDTCPWCSRVKTYLRQNNVRFHEINVSRDPSAAQRMVARSGQQGVPQVDIDGTMIVGFDKGRIDTLLELAGRPAS